MIWLVLLSFVASPVVIDSVDLAELNHVFQREGQHHHASYWVWYDWQEINGHWDYRCRDWRKMEDVPFPTNGIQEFWDAKAKVNRRVESKIFREISTWYDRESEDRKYLPEIQRRKLRTK